MESISDPELTVEIIDPTIDSEVTQSDIIEIFGGEQQLVEYTAQSLANIIHKIKILKPFIKVLGVARDWALMKHKVITFEKELSKMSKQIDKLRQSGEFNTEYYKSEEFISTIKFLVDGIERAHTDDHIANLRRAYINLLNIKNYEVNLKHKYAELASITTPYHISILKSISEVMGQLSEDDKKTKWVTVEGAVAELSKNNQKITYSDAAFLIRELEKLGLVECDFGDENRFKDIPDYNKWTIPLLLDRNIVARPTGFGLQFLRMVQEEY